MKASLLICIVCVMVVIGVGSVGVLPACAAESRRVAVAITSQGEGGFVDHHPLFPFHATVRDEVLDKSFQETLLSVRAIATNAYADSAFASSFSPSPICFISYVCQDIDMRWSRLIEAYLRQAGVQTIFDRRHLGGGDAIERFIKEGVHKATFALLLFSPRYLKNYRDRTYIYDEAEAIRVKWEQVVDFVIPVLIDGSDTDSIPLDCLGVDCKGRLSVLYVPMTDHTQQTTYEECLGGIHRILSERLFKPVIGIGAPYEREFECLKRRFDARKRRLPMPTMQIELKAARGSFPQSLKPHKAFIDRTDEKGQPYVDVIFEALFMEGLEDGSMEKRPFAEITLCALSGMGGIGKTTLATEFVHKYKSFYPFIYWMDGNSKREFQLSCLALLETLGVRAPNLREEAGEEDKDAYLGILIEQIKEHLPHRKKNWLLVVDNVDEPSFTTEFKPEGGHILYTSRSKEWLNQPIILDVFKESESIAYLRQMTGFDETHTDSARALAMELDHLPLALAQAAAYIRRQRTELYVYTFTDYLREYQARYARLLEQKQIQPSLNRREAIVMTTWDATMHKLSADARQLIGCFSYMSPTAIPLQVFSESITPEGAIADLIMYSMVNYDSKAKLLSIHRLVQCVAREKYERLLTFKPIISDVIDIWALWFDRQLMRASSLINEEVSLVLSELTHHGQHHLNILQQHIETLVRRERLDGMQAVDMWIYTKMLDYHFVNTSLKSVISTFEDPSIPSLVEEILSEIDVKKRDQILACIKDIFGENFLDTNHMMCVINTFNQYLSEELDGFCAHIKTCIRPDMMAEERRKIIMMFDEILIDRRDEFIENTRFLHEADMTAEIFGSYLWAFADSENYFRPGGAFGFDEHMPDSDGEEGGLASEVDDVEEHILPYYAYLDQLINLKIPEELYENAMDFVPRLSVDDSLFITHVVDNLFQIDEDGCYHVIKCMAGLNREDANVFAERVYGLLTQEMDVSQRYMFIMKFAELEHPELIFSGIDKVRELRQRDGKTPIINNLVSQVTNNYLAVLVYQALITLVDKK